MDDKSSSSAKDGHGVEELARIIDQHLNPVSSSITSATTSTRTYSPPLMGTSARAAKRRLDSDGAPIRIEGTDIQSPHYQNLRQTDHDQRSVPLVSSEASSESPQSFSAKHDLLNEQIQTSSARQEQGQEQQHQQQSSQAATTQKIITTITTTTATTASSASSIDPHDRTSSSSNESPSVDHVLEQAVQLQRLSQATTSSTGKNIQPEAVVIERTEQYQVFLDSSNHEIRRTPSVSRTTLVPITKAGHATDLDEAQAQVDRLTDDHQAIQHLSRALHEHTQATTREYKRLPSTQKSSIEKPVEPVPSVVPSDFSVIDALISNPLGTSNERSNSRSQMRYQNILSNVRNPEWVHLLKQSVVPTKKKSKEKKVTKEKKDTAIAQNVVTTPLTSTSEQLSSPSIEPITTHSLEETPLIDPKDKKKTKKEAKKTKTKPKPKPKSQSKSKVTQVDYQVIDAIVGSPIAMRLPDSYLSKYKVSPPLSPPPAGLSLAQTSDTLGKTSEITSKDNQPSPSASSLPATTATNDDNNNNKNETVLHLERVVRDLFLHHAAALTASVSLSPSTTTPTVEVKDSAERAQKSTPVTNEVIQQNPLLNQGQTTVHSSGSTSIEPLRQTTQTEPAKPRVIYRYMDEEGNILAISSTPPSQLRDQAPSSPIIYQTTNSIRQPQQEQQPSTYHRDRHIVIDDERRHPLPQYEHRATWQGEPKLPKTMTREDLEMRDKRVPQVTDLTDSSLRTIPVAYEPEPSSKVSSTAQSSRVYHYPNQQNVKLAWLPLSYQPEPNYVPTSTGGGGGGYETDSTISERSANYRSYDYTPVDTRYRSPHRSPIYYHQEYQYRPSPGPTYYPPPPPLPYGVRAVSPEYGQPRNYLEVFRGGDFQDTKPSEVYSLPLSEYSRHSPIQPGAFQRHSRYDRYQSEKYGTMGNPRSIPSLQPHHPYSSHIPSSTTAPSTVYASSYYTHHPSPSNRPVQRSPHSGYTTNSIRHSKSFDYRPLRTRLQREYKITPNLLVDEWDYPSVSEKIHYSTATSTTNRSGVSSPDDVFLSNRTSTEYRWHVRTPHDKPSNRPNEPAPSSPTDTKEVKQSPPPKPPLPIHRALALHNFQSQSNRELSFKKGETFLVKRRINDDWYEGEHQGVTGIFPASYVELFPSENPQQETRSHDQKREQHEGEAIVKYDFIPQKTFELQLRKGDKVTLLRRLNNNWYEGRLKNVEGIFPAAYVETLREPSEFPSSSEPSTSALTMPKSVLKNSTSAQPAAFEKKEKTTRESPPMLMRKCQVLYNYTPQNPDELEIHVGDIITIVEMCDDGWYCGLMENSKYSKKMEFGTFPGNYVKLLPEDE